jgi:bacillithiol system protein YtxJ
MSPWESLSEAKWEALLAAPLPFLLVYKHSNRCPVSTWAKRSLNSVPVYPWPTVEVDVIGQRPLSQRIAGDLEVHHESPQLILVKHGKAVAQVSHDSVTADTVALWEKTFS